MQVEKLCYFQINDHKGFSEPQMVGFAIAPEDSGFEVAYKQVKGKSCILAVLQPLLYHEVLGRILAWYDNMTLYFILDKAEKRVRGTANSIQADVPDSPVLCFARA